MRNAIVLTLLAISARQISGLPTDSQSKAYTENEWGQILKGGFGHCSTPGKPCSIGKRAALAVAQAISLPDPKGWPGFCPDSDKACPEPHIAAPNPESMSHGKLGFCSVPSMNCSRRHDALDKIGRAAESAHYRIWARENEAEAIAQATYTHTPLLGACAVPGMACMGFRDLSSRSDRISWCSTNPNESCSSRRDAVSEILKARLSSDDPEDHLAEDTSQNKSIRDELQNLDSELDDRECYAEHGPCTDILKARDIFEAIKNSGPLTRSPELADAEIPEAARAHLSIGHLKLAREAEAGCYGAEGACSNAKRAVDELETAINEAVALL